MTTIKRIASAGLVSLALLAAACSTQRPAPPSATRPAPPGRAMAAADYVAAAGSIDLFVTRASDLALVRSSDARVRALARRLAEEHRGLGAQLSLAGRRVNLLPAARLMPREAQRLSWLESLPSVDEAYRRQMIVTHEQSLALHGAFAARGGSPTLRPVAAHAEATERAHLAKLRAR